MTGETSIQGGELPTSGQQFADFLDREQGQNPLDDDLLTFGRLLAERLGETDVDGDPEAYKTVVVALVVDCMLGVSRATQEPMPENLSEMPAPVASFYRQFAGYWGTRAFGETTGSRIEEIFRQSWPAD